MMWPQYQRSWEALRAMPNPYDYIITSDGLVLDFLGEVMSPSRLIDEGWPPDVVRGQHNWIEEGNHG